MDRRESLKIIAAATVGASLPGCGPREIERAADAVAPVDGSFEAYGRRYFSEHEMQTVRVLADLVIPADDRSGSASDARVPEFIDFMASDVENLRTPLRGGLAWLDHYARRESGRMFVDASADAKLRILDAIAWPESAEPEVSQGVRFFSMFRDLCASGFFSSRMGVEDIEYMGNTPIPEWKGCTDEAMNHVRSRARVN